MQNTFKLILKMDVADTASLDAAESTIATFVAGQPAGSTYQIGYSTNGDGVRSSVATINLVVADHSDFATKLSFVYANLNALPNVTEIMCNFQQSGFPE